MDSQCEYSAEPTVVQDYNADPRVVQTSHSGYRADKMVVHYSADPKGRAILI